MISEQHRKQFLQELQQNKYIDYQEILKIADAFQIASGQSYAEGRTKALLDFINLQNSLVIKNFNNTGQDKLIYTVKEFAIMLKNVDQFIDLENDKEFKAYF